MWVTQALARRYHCLRHHLYHQEAQPPGRLPKIDTKAAGINRHTAWDLGRQSWSLRMAPNIHHYLRDITTWHLLLNWTLIPRALQPVEELSPRVRLWAVQVHQELPVSHQLNHHRHGAGRQECPSHLLHRGLLRLQGRIV